MHDQKIAIITGANSGIGKQAAILIAKQNYKVILACRNPEKGKIALANIQQESKNESVELIIVDMSLQSSIREFYTLVSNKFDKIDVIIHNAAIFDISQKMRKFTNEGIETIWATNHLGPILMNELLMDLLKKSKNGRIITISSKGLLAKPFLKINENDPELLNEKFNVVKSYYHSKLAQNMYTLWLAKKLSETNITVNAIRVPAVQIDISKYPNIPNFLKKLYKIKACFSIKPIDMGKTYAFLASSPALSEKTGSYFNEKNKEVKFRRYTKNWGAIDKLMELSFKAIKTNRKHE